MVKRELLVRLASIVNRLREVSARSGNAQLGWETIEIEKEIEAIENVLSAQIDEYMSNKLRMYNATKGEKYEKEARAAAARIIDRVTAAPRAGRPGHTSGGAVPLR